MEIRKIKPMLAELGSVKDLGRKNWCFEPKMDGSRVICYNYDASIRFLNRRGKFTEYKYPEMYGIWKTIKAQSCILDAEIVVFDPKTGKPSFNLLAEREHQESKLRIDLLSKKIPATLVVFDILEFEGEDVTSKPLHERKNILEKVIVDTDHLKKCFWTPRGEELWKAIKKMRLEGVMAKDSHSPYLEGKRSDFWLKIKALKTLDVVIGGYTIGGGRRRGTFGALLCGIYYKNKLNYLGRVGTGWDERQLVEFSKVLRRLETKKNPFDVFEEERAVKRKTHWVQPRLVAEVKFMNLSKELKMRAPSFKYFRIDKAPEDCVLQEKDVKSLTTR